MVQPPSPPAKRLKPQSDPDQDQTTLVRCPRCDSSRTKFCYYNNYSLSQPRYFCKSCRRYWTKGGTLRNIPIGGLSRKSKKMGPVSAADRRRCGEMQLQTAATMQYDDKLAVVPDGVSISSSSTTLQHSYPESSFHLSENHDFIFEDLTIDFMERGGSGRDYTSSDYFPTLEVTGGYDAITSNIQRPSPFADTMSYYDAQYEKIINGDYDVKPKLFETSCYLGLSGAERHGSSGCPLGLGPSWAGLSGEFGCLSTNQLV